MVRRGGAKMMIVILLLALAAVFFLYQYMFVEVYEYRYSQTGEAFKNPMMGFAPNANYTKAVGDNTLVYVDITWRELEPEEGVFAFTEIAESNHLKEWRKQGKKVVFRFVCDIPGNEAHMDIPDWLYEKTGDGTFYDSSYGKGYSPDYENPVFIAYHSKAIEALGKEYGQDTFFCFIELGSLGHWGEWHVKYDAGIKRFPAEAVCRQYVEPYLAAFPNAKLLMRRPFSFVKEYGLGVYNDMTGEPDATESWLDWIYHGGVYQSASEPLELPACEKIWENAPVGGEFTSALSMEEMLVTKQEQTLGLLQESHMTFIGPKCPIANEEELDYPEEVEEVLKNIGYRYGISSAKVVHNRLSGTVSVKAEVTNYGAAPMYFPWKFCMYFLDRQGKVLARGETGLDLTELEQWAVTSVRIKWQDESLKEIRPVIAVGIENSETGNPEVFLDMDVKIWEKMYILNAENY